MSLRIETSPLAQVRALWKEDGDYSEGGRAGFAEDESSTAEGRETAAEEADSAERTDSAEDGLRERRGMWAYTPEAVSRENDPMFKAWVSIHSMGKWMLSPTLMALILGSTLRALEIGFSVICLDV